MPARTEDILEYVQRVHRTYGFWGVLPELLIIGAVVWAVLRFLRGTRGARLLTGFLLVLLVSHLVMQWVAAKFNLTRLQYLYERFLLLLTFGSIVIFQPELRRALSRLGEARLFRGRRRELIELVDELDDAVRTFSKNKIGSILAIERNVGLGQVIESGVPMDAKVTASLLRSVFWPGSALHDLGVVIAGNRIAAARCQFPLAEVGTGPDTLGSRHRAAVGLTEDSDALVVVVSEETGRVSFCERGALETLTDIDRFRGDLSNRLGMETIFAKPRSKSAAELAATKSSSGLHPTVSTTPSGKIVVGDPARKSSPQMSTVAAAPVPPGPAPASSAAGGSSGEIPIPSPAAPTPIPAASAAKEAVR